LSIAGEDAIRSLLQTKEAELAVSVGVIDRQQKELESSVEMVIT
jgi:hypothetical protein